MRYKALADQIVDDIRNSKLQHGKRMPSLRQLASQFDVSMTTAINCYHSLEAMGWVVARPQSGFYVSSPMKKGNTPNQPQFRSQPRNAQPTTSWNSPVCGKALTTPLAISQINPQYLPTKALQQSLKRGLTLLADNIHYYPDPQGLPTLRQALENQFIRNGLPVNDRDIVITGGCIDAVRMALEVTTNPGDAIAISSPCFNGLLELLSTLSRKVVEVPCNEQGIDLVQLERLFKKSEVKAGLFSSSHMNPQGTSLSTEQKQRLAELANHYKIPMIEDDIYAELGYNKVVPLPVKYWDNGGYVLLCGSVSKTLSAGVRIGWCLPGRYIDEYLYRYTAGGLGNNVVVQAGLANFINSGQYQKNLNQIRAKLFTHICAYRNLLLQWLPPESAVSQPQGGMVLWVQVPALNAEKLQQLAKKQGIDIILGQRFTTRNLYHDCFRLNAGWSLLDSYDDKRTVEEALQQLALLVYQAVS